MNEKHLAITFKKPVLIYLPCYNCGNIISEVLDRIPDVFSGIAECFCIDNHSTDRTSEMVSGKRARLQNGLDISLVRTKQDYGYAGSQKIAYSLACRNHDVKNVIMLHGDGQYNPSLLTKFLPFINSDYAVVNGYRDKRLYPVEEETPPLIYYTIKLLSSIESLITGFKQKEWHSGFVMYSTNFLRCIPLAALSNTRHIDGEMLYFAGITGAKTASVPIYKQYVGRNTFHGLATIRYVIQVFQIMARFKTNYYHKSLKAKDVADIDYAYDVLA